MNPTFRYISVLAPPDQATFLTTLQSYGASGWQFITVYNGYIFFMQKTVTQIE